MKRSTLVAALAAFVGLTPSLALWAESIKISNDEAGMLYVDGFKVGRITPHDASQPYLINGMDPGVHTVRFTPSEGGAETVKAVQVEAGEDASLALMASGAAVDSLGSTDTESAPAPAAKHARAHARAKVRRGNAALAITGGILTGVGVAMILYGFWPTDSNVTLTNLNGGYSEIGVGPYYNFNYEGTVNNNSSFSIDSLDINIDQYDHSGNYRLSLTSSPSSVPAGNSSMDWSDEFDDVYFGSGTPGNFVATPKVSGYGATNALVGWGGILVMAGGITCLILGLTRVQTVMDNNDVSLNLIPRDSDRLMLAASKGF